MYIDNDFAAVVFRARSLSFSNNRIPPGNRITVTTENTVRTIPLPPPPVKDITADTVHVGHTP